MAEWRKIPGLPERYEASSEGQIRNLPYERIFKKRYRNGEIKTHRRFFDGKIIEPKIGKRGYWKGHLVVNLRTDKHDGKSAGCTEFKVGMLVARAFLGLPYNPDDQREVQQWKLIHKDGDPHNCRVDNLEWVHVGNSINEPEHVRRNRLAWEERKKNLFPDWLRELYADEWYDFVEAA